MALRRSGSALAESLSAALARGKTELDSLTGASRLAALADGVASRDAAFAAARAELRVRKAAFDEALCARAAAQQELSTLLQRKPSWSTADVGRFTEQLRLEHVSQAAEAAALASLRQAEEAVDGGLVAFVDALRERYQQETAYAETGRRISTWGTLALVAVNTALFAGTQLVFEPAKRRRTHEAIRTLMHEQGDAIVLRLSGSQTRDEEEESGAHLNPPPVTAPPLLSPEVAFSALLHSVLGEAEARRTEAEERMEAKLHAIADAVNARHTSSVAEAHAGGDARARMAAAWLALPPGPLLGRREEWVAALLSVAAAGGIAAALTLAALSGR
jgi:sensitive to high expression protein 9